MLANIVIISFIVFCICTFVFSINYTEEQHILYSDEEFEHLAESYRPVQKFTIYLGALSFSSFIVSGVLLALSILIDLWIKYVI